MSPRSLLMFFLWLAAIVAGMAVALAVLLLAVNALVWLGLV